MICILSAFKATVLIKQVHHEHFRFLFRHYSQAVLEVGFEKLAGEFRKQLRTRIVAEETF